MSAEYSVEEVRARFEAWAKPTYGIGRHPGLPDQYAATGVQCAWAAWQVAYANRIEADERAVGVSTRHCSARVIHPKPSPPGPGNPPIWCCLQEGHEGPHRHDGGGMYLSIPFRENDEVSMLASTPPLAQAAQVDRARETPRRQQAVEMLLELGWVYNIERGWEEPAPTAEPVAHAGADGGVGIDCVSHSSEPVAQGEAGRTVADDVRDFGNGFSVDGKHIDPSRIVIYPATHPHSPDAADSVPVDARAREMLASEFERGHPATQYPEYARIARGSHDILTMAAIRAISAALSEHQADSGRVGEISLRQALQIIAEHAEEISSSPVDSAWIAETAREALAAQSNKADSGRMGDMVQVAEKAFWPAYLECKRKHGSSKDAHATGMRAALEVALAAQGRGDSDGMCNEDHPERRCICREEFGHRVCGTTPPASPAGVPDGLQQVFAIPKSYDWADESDHGRFGDAQKFLAGFGLVIAAPSATPEGGEVDRDN